MQLLNENRSDTSAYGYGSSKLLLFSDCLKLHSCNKHASCCWFYNDLLMHIFVFLNDVNPGINVFTCVREQTCKQTNNGFFKKNYRLFFQKSLTDENPICPQHELKSIELSSLKKMSHTRIYIYSSVTTRHWRTSYFWTDWYSESVCGSWIKLKLYVL